MDSLAVYEVLVKQHEKMLFAYVLGFTADAALAEDITQEAFIIAYQKLASLKKKECFGAWLRVIARNIALGQLRRNCNEIVFDPEVIAGMEDVFGEPDQTSDAFDVRVKSVEHCYRQLPEKLHAVCKLHYFEDQSTSQISLTLGVSLAAVLKRLERSRYALLECVRRRLRIEAG